MWRLQSKGSKGALMGMKSRGQQVINTQKTAGGAAWMSRGRGAESRRRYTPMV
jgi:hypothetical protein